MSALALVLLALGVLAAVASCAGALLARDAAARLHYVAAGTVTATPLVGLGVALEAGVPTAGGVQTLIAVALLLLQAPMSSHALGRLAHLRRGAGG